MRDIFTVFLYAIVTIIRLGKPGGLRCVVAESVLMRHQLLILNRGRKRAPNLRSSDRIVAGLCTLLMRPVRVLRSAIVLKPATLLNFHKMLVKQKYPHYGCLAGPICGARTGFAIPKNTTTPWPPQRVESASSGVPTQLSMSCQLFITQTSPAGPIAMSVCLCSPPPTYPPGGEIWSPVLKPGGQFSVRTPQSSVIGLLGIAKLEIQTLSLPSTTTAQGPGRPSPVNGEPGYCVPSGRSRVTLPSLPFCLDMVLVMYSVADSNPSSFKRAAMSTSRAMPSSPSPNRLVTHTLPWLSMLRPLLTNPVLKFSTFVGSEAGKRVTLSLAFETQIRSC